MEAAPPLTDDDGSLFNLTLVSPDPIASSRSRSSRLKKIGMLQKEIASEDNSAYVERFDLDTAHSNIVVSSVSVDDVEFLATKIEDERQQAASSAAALHRRRLLETQQRETEAKQRVKDFYLGRLGDMRTKHIEIVNAERSALAELRKAFRTAEEEMKDRLVQRQAEVKAQYGNLKRTGRRFGVTDREYHLDWQHAPQPVEIQIKCLRAVKDKLPRGRYVIHARLFDRLAGHEVKWARVDEHLWKDHTFPSLHGGLFNSVDISVDQTLRLVFPAEVDLSPSMCIVFELYLLKGRHKQVDEVVAHGVYPVCDAALRCVRGKFKTMLLLGGVDTELDKYSKIENAVSSQFDRWLCNMYFEVSHLPRITQDKRYAQQALNQYCGGWLSKVPFMRKQPLQVSEYEYKLQQTERLLGFDLFNDDSNDDGVGFDVKLKQIEKASGVVGAEDSEAGETRNAAGIEESVNWQSYQFSVLPPQSARTLNQRGMVDTMGLVWREILTDIGSHQWHTFEFKILAMMLLSTYYLRMFFHVTAQWALLSLISTPVTVFKIHTLPEGVGIPTSMELTYENQQLSPYFEIGIVAIGPLFNLVVLVGFVAIAVISTSVFGSYSDLLSLLTAAWCFATVADPFLFFIQDALTANWQGDFAKLYSMYNERTGDGAVGIFLTCFIYLAFTVMSVMLSYMYFLKLYMNGRVNDAVVRIDSEEGSFIVPHDLELSFEELSFICEEASKFHGYGGAKRKVTVDTLTVVDKADAGVKRTLLHIQVRTILADDPDPAKCTNQLYRHFLRDDAGQCLEIFATCRAEINAALRGTAPGVERLLFPAAKEK